MTQNNFSYSSKDVAVIGSGISGLSAAWLLHRNGANVTLYEKETTCGGHTLTDTTSDFPVDLGFQVYNLTTYPNLVGFFEQLGVDTAPSDMSFALSMDDGQLEWGSDNLNSVFAQRKNMYNPSFLRMLYEVTRFGKEAPKVLEPTSQQQYKDMSLGDYLKEKKFSHSFIYNYVVPMCAAVWSVPNAQVLNFPVQMLIRFWVNHHLLDIFQRPLWRVVKGRSQEYVKRVISELRDVRTGRPVASIKRPSAKGGGKVIITTEQGEMDQFDAVVLATHSDISMRLLGEDISPDEKEVLSAIPYNDNDVYLHTDVTLMPRNRKTWSSWNLIGRSDAEDTSAVCVSYYVNRLQELPAGASDLFVTLNPLHPPAADKVIRRLSLAHPVFSFSSVSAQGRLAELQGHRGTFYAGAWCGYGFHEDGIKSAVAAVTSMGAKIPWEPRSTSPKSTWMEQLYMSLFDQYAKATFTSGFLRVILPSGHELLYGSKDSVVVPGAKGDEWRGRPVPCATLRVFNFDFFRKIILRHDTGLGEAYMERDFETDSIGGLMSVILANAEATEVHRGKMGFLNWVGDKLLWLAHLGRPNTIAGSRRNIEEHYDAGNAMYRLFLDESMMYSSAIHNEGETLYQAQMNKLDAIIKQADIKEGDHVLEIGCGWGGFAIRAAQTTGCRVTGLTISKEQLSEATARVKAAGLENKVTLLFCDYRDCPGAGTYDKVVSIEMIEAVGHEHLPPYFSVIGNMLKPGGKAVIQAISVPDERYEAYSRCSDFIREHIFPGGHLPSVGAMVEASRGTGLDLKGVTDIGPHYAITLRAWREAWEKRRDEILALGYSDRFWRKFRFYFVYCEAGFDYRYIHNFHLVWVKKEMEEGREALGGGHRGNTGAAAFLSEVRNEVPSDPITQVLLAVYFFLAGLLVKGHPFMWLLPVVSCVCGAAHFSLNRLSNRLLPFYRTLSPEKQAWWCADLAHLVFSSAVSTCSLMHVLSAPGALLPGRQAPPFSPSSLYSVSCALACASAGFFAFHLWVAVRYRLYSSSYKPIAHYTLLLLLFVVGAYRGVSLSLLSATLVGELSNVPFLAGKLLNLAGASGPSRVSSVVLGSEKVLLALTIVVHTVILVLVAASRSSFGRASYHCVALLGLGYCNITHWHRVHQIRTRQKAAEAIQGPTESASSRAVTSAGLPVELAWRTQQMTDVSSKGIATRLVQEAVGSSGVDGSSFKLHQA
ncbi:hypothetical protein CEUSTIGMA_g9817.t1 [Chlamydomonas eustigma]|uniref:Amine oxidase domain-containing protein n=1 Tax=Chlamydomonas eustigma TaxID=1157962 RepID=A0A250XHJ1_9CHLO|nr:hypothetical protein CEUSTIGMA_g9817.t1 [Chlamydomonas eustigma]|eukprot:GAX82389.1 hypothetical protein CEUSTIGMA_g9817.t1 [Chlamydomonas eustigma]